MQKKSSSFFVIDKKKLLENLNALKSKNICFMVKANAYGHGLLGICEILRGKVKFFGVATLEEALIVRKIDMITPILVVGISDFFDDELSVYNVIKKVIEKNISITIDNIKQLQMILLFLNKENKEREKADKAAERLKLKIHIKINSGMNRLGINDLNEFKEILKIINGNKNLIFEGIYTHFATATSDIPYVNKQLKIFEKFLKCIPPIFNPLIHLGGGDIVDLPEFQKQK
ncbi:MAG: alanine racemase, partial [Clostridia bacterium]|nr:alanine racemase [Clostridia bacterium]